MKPPGLIPISNQPFFRMKKNTGYAISTLFYLLLLTLAFRVSHTSAATNEHTYLQIDYYVLTEAVAPQFVDTKKRFWKPLQQKRIAQGDIKSWHLYEALLTAPSSDYHFITITTSRHFGKLFEERDASLLANLFPGKNKDDLLKKMHHGFQVSSREIWRVESEALPKEATGPTGNYITKNFMDVRGASGEHATIELDFWKPIHYARIDHNVLSSWGMYTLVRPGGTSRKYAYSTIDYYDQLADIEHSVANELAVIAHPDLSNEQISDFFGRTGQARSAYKGELWHLIDHATTDEK